VKVYPLTVGARKGKKKKKGSWSAASSFSTFPPIGKMEKGSCKEGLRYAPGKEERKKEEKGTALQISVSPLAVYAKYRKG